MEPKLRPDEIVADHDAIVARLGDAYKIDVTPVTYSFAFAVMFSQLFMQDLPFYVIVDQLHMASRSNWTYHTAYTVRRVASLLGLACRFEAEGRRDAIIQTLSDDPIVLLAIEWEWIGDDVFGKGGELDKLADTCTKHQDADAMLLTWCDQGAYPDFLKRIADHWDLRLSRSKSRPTLYLNVVTHAMESNKLRLKQFRTVEIHADSIFLWEDHFFA